MTQPNGRSSEFLLKLTSLLWPFVITLVTNVVLATSLYYRSMETLRAEIIAQAAASRAEERSYQDEKRQSYVTVEKFLGFQKDEQRELYEIRTALALLREEIGRR